MFGCIRRLGCLVFLLVIGVLAWFNRDRLMPLYDRVRGRSTADSTIVRTPGGWEPLTAEKATRGQRTLESLSRPTGPPSATLTPGEAASYIFLAVARQLPASSQDISASVTGDRLYVKANVALADFGGGDVLGALGSLLGDRDTVQLGGTVNVLQRGMGEFQVKDVKLGQFPVPGAIVPRLVARIRRGEMPPGISPNALPMKLPEYIGDVRIANGRITVYRTATQ
ncbi:MAG TPA: hypothetical protein VM939_14135 [Gemmatimonadaceae bacterium]|nr:hypothetical protein [Gemmatimonadaceae bacterium]